MTKPAAQTQITLRLEGSRAELGVSLSDFESFIDSFLGALRDFDRDRREAPTRKSGRPERRAEAVTAFRLVRFEPGSGIATIEPELVSIHEQEQLPLEEIPLSLENLLAMADEIDAGAVLPEPVTDALAKACRAFGADGSIAIHLPGRPRPTVIDMARLGHGAPIGSEPEREVRSVSGRLHLLDVEPDKLAIRTSSGVDWTCRYPERLEPKVKQLVDKLVWVEGPGRRVSSLRGTMTIERIDVVEQGDQSMLFTLERVPDSELVDQQGIEQPQGLHSIADPEWDDERDDAYLAALLGK